MPSAKVLEIALDTRGSWWTFSTRAKGGDMLSRPGLWKPADAAGKLLAFDVPARRLGLTQADVPELTSWAGACLDGTVQATHASAELPGIDAQRLTAQVSTHTCTGQVVVRDGRLYVDFPLGDVPEDLPVPARQWLDATLVAARRLRMVRVETCNESGAVHARVELTGAPPAWLSGLLDEAVLCLRAAVERLLPAITFLTTAGVKCRALEPATPAPALKKTNKNNKEKKT